MSFLRRLPLMLPALQGHESEDEAVAAGGGAVAPEQERRMLSSVIDGILGDSDDEAAEEEGSEEDDDEEGSEEEGSEEEGSASEGEEEEEEAEEEAAAYPAAADPFSRKHLQQKAAAAAGADAAAAQQQLRQRAEPEAGATVFIRGLPLDVSKEQVFQKMKVGWVGLGWWGRRENLREGAGIRYRTGPCGVAWDVRHPGCALLSGTSRASPQPV